MRTVAFKIEKALLEALDRYCEVKGVTRSDAIREAIRLLLSKHTVRIANIPKAWVSKQYDPAPVW